MKFKNKTIKLISAILIFSALAPTILFSMPKHVEAQWVVADWLGFTAAAPTAVSTGASATNETIQTGFEVKKFAKEIVQQVFMTIANRFLQEMTKSTINWINSGFHGNPLFLPNPESFFKDIAKYEIKNLVDTFGYDTNRYPFGRDWALNVISSYKTQAATNAEYTLSRVINDPVLLRNYRNDFNVGGWNGFLTNTQYPQNNYVGWNMQQTEALARKLNGNVQNKTQQVQKTLDQGMGFLSPKKCVTNPNYNNLRNEFQQPKFDPNKELPYDPPVGPQAPRQPDPNEPNFEEEFAKWENQMGEWSLLMEKNKQDVAKYDRDREAQIATLIKPSWDMKNACPNKADGTSGFAVTTPGTVVSDQIKNAMGSQFRKSELAASLGNSISAITDAFITHFLNKGLTALATKVNPKPVPDDWSYMGQTLGSPADGTNVAWDAGPDEVVKVDDFKKLLLGKTVVTGADGTILREEIGNTGNGQYIPGDIANTQAELRLMDNNSLSDPGITQVVGNSWPKIRELDICLPGPDIGWEKRVLEETERNGSKLQEKSSDDDPEKAAAAKMTFKSLEYAAGSFKNWVESQMMGHLPGGINYMDEINNIEELHQQWTELNDRRRAKSQTLTRLQALQNNLTAFTTQPAAGSEGEKNLINIRKQYNAIRSSVSSTVSIEDTRNELNTSKEKLANLNRLAAQCGNEREQIGWTEPYGRLSTLDLSNAEVTAMFNAVGLGNEDDEQRLFCEGPLTGGYSHESFINRNDYVAYPAIPLVNAKDVLTYGGWPTLRRVGRILKMPGAGEKKVTIEMNCDIIYRAYLFNYKADLPDPIGVIVTELPPDGVNNDNTQDEEESDTGDEGEVSCHTNDDEVQVGETAEYWATGGDGEYFWSQNDANPPTGEGREWSTSWSAPSGPGGKVIFVESEGRTSQCETVIE